MEPVDFYCERVAAGFGGEPLNAVTGLAFLAVGLWRWPRCPEQADRHVALALMLLGVAACLHHLFALRFTLQADIWANILYLGTFGALLLRRLAGVGPLAVVAALATVIALTELLGVPGVRAVLGRWADMFVLMTLLLLGLGLVLGSRGLALAGLVLAAGLPLRFLDHAACGALPLGTHWLWHLVNAGSIAIALTALARHRRVA